MIRFFIGTLLILGGATVLPANDELTARPPTTMPAPFAGKSFPLPPQQKSPWTPPKSNLPESLSKAIDSLFAQGMADPRGCEYRLAEVAVGNVWGGGGGGAHIHAWVLPADPASKQRFVICWNGLVYPAISVGDKADLQGDIEAILAADQKAKEDYIRKQTPKNAAFPYRRSWGVTPEQVAVSHESMTMLKPCMLFRIGEAALTEKYWTQLSPTKDDGNEDPYLVFAMEWAWCTWDRAVCAHMRGDDAVSLLSAQVLEISRPQIEATAAARGFKRPLAMDPRDGNRELPNPPYLGTVYDRLPELVKDEQRRTSAAEKPLSLRDAIKIPDKAKRIAALIRDFEDVAEMQDGQPGGVTIDNSEIVQAVEKEGEDAVEPLLACLENDDRLTRSVSFGRDFHPGRNLIPVAEAAYAALGHILQTRDFGAGSDGHNRGGGGSRKALAAEIRAFWQKNKGKSPAERWYATLSDDNADPSQWVEAARLIVQPSDVEERGRWVVTPMRKDGKVPPIRGEELRAKKDPSVAELIARRIPAIAARNDGWLFAQHDATQVALSLSKWDPQAAIPVLREQMQRCKAAAARPYAGGQTTELMARCITDISTALTASGDKGAFKEYAGWIASKLPDGNSGFEDAKSFEVMWQHPDDPDIAEAAEKIFNDPSSPWHSRPKSGVLGVGRESDLIATPLLALPAFRKNVLANLADMSKIGTVGVEGNQVSVKTDKGGSVGFGSNPDPADPLVPKAGERRPLRVCDWFAGRLSALDGAPQFELYWPEEKRDAAIKEFVIFVQEWGVAFRYGESQKALNFMGMMEIPHMTFPKRDRPATEAEVKAHTAIFSLPAGAGTRAVALKRFPVKAKWTTLRRFPIRVQGFDTKTNTQTITTEYDQMGLVWQAEEVEENGHWKRYYGFVGNHVIAKVPAEELQLFENADPSDPTVQ